MVCGCRSVENRAHYLQMKSCILNCHNKHMANLHSSIALATLCKCAVVGYKEGRIAWLVDLFNASNFRNNKSTYTFTSTISMVPSQSALSGPRVVSASPLFPSVDLSVSRCGYYYCTFSLRRVFCYTLAKGSFHFRCMPISFASIGIKQTRNLSSTTYECSSIARRSVK